MRAAGVVDLWPARFAEIRQGQIVDTRIWGELPPHFVGTPSMNEIGKFLARDLTVHTEHKLISARRVDGRWLLEFDGSGAYATAFDMLVFAIPAPQAATILPDEIKTVVPAVETPMTGCFALMLGFDAPLDLPFDAALIDDPTLSWLSVDTSKPGRPPTASLTVLSRNDWAQAHMEDDVHQVQAHMLQALDTIAPTRSLKPIYQNIHRWRFANATNRRHADIIFDAPHQIGLCGDWCEGGRVEAAFTAAARLADHILSSGMLNHAD
jgi:predicted NAD/FAD-dependent oxidoreductase